MQEGNVRGVEPEKGTRELLGVTWGLLMGTLSPSLGMGRPGDYLAK